MTPDKPDPRKKVDFARMTNIFGRLTDTEKEPDRPKVLENEIGMKLALIPSGLFHMGSHPDDPGARANETPRKKVEITRPFYLGVNPVTQAEFERLVGTNPAQFAKAAGGGPDHPVERVSWEHAAAFCRRLSALPAERAAGRAYRLPTEAEWEYAARAGSNAAFAFGDELLPAQANFGGAYGPDGLPRPPARGMTSPVGAYPPNNYGLFDVHGNVWEWCGDWYDEAYYAGGPKWDPEGPETGRFRVARGGCWRSLAGSCRAAYRNALVPVNRDPYTGFRVVAVVAT